MKEVNCENVEPKKSLNFIEQIVENDLREGLNDGRICGASLYDSKSENEEEANIFASFFLMPYDGVEWYIEVNQIKEWTVYEVIRLSLYFGISYLATIRRLEREKRITQRNKQRDSIDDDFDTVINMTNRNNNKKY